MKRGSYAPSGTSSKTSGKSGSLKFKGRYSSAASLQSSMNLKRKEAFDNESQMLMDDTTTEANVTYVTSTTDYLRKDGQDARSRNLDASFDESDGDSRGQDPSAKLSMFASRSQGSANTRERKWTQEREWDRDRHRRATVEPSTQARNLSRPRSSRRSSYDERTSYCNLINPIVVEDSGSSNDDELVRKPRSNRQIGSTPAIENTMARDGYDSDSYSMKASRQKLKADRRGKASRASKRQDPEETHTDSQRREPTRSSLLEDSTTNFDDSMAFAPSTATNSKANSATDSFLAESAGKVKMTKMEKIKQLQAKNERYKEEYKKTYLEKKEFKKKYEDKKMEVASLTSEIESYMKETGLLKKQLHQLTYEVESAEDNPRKDSTLVAKLRKDLKESQLDLKQALARLADRKLESNKLQEILQRKDEQIESLTLEVSRQIEEVQKLQAKISIQDKGNRCSRDTPNLEAEEKLAKLTDEHENVKAELSMTLTRAAEMVKNREGTIEILRKENREMKELLDIRDADDDRTTVSQKIQGKEDIISQLRTEIAGLKETLDENDEDHDQLKEVIKNREAELKTLKADIDGLKKMVKRAEKEANKAKKEADEKDATIGALEEEIRDQRNKSKDAVRNVEEMKMAIKSREGQIKDLQDTINLLKENQDGSCERLGKTRASLKDKEEEMKALYRENENLKADILQQREKLDERRKTIVLQLEDAKMREKELQDQVEATETMVKQRDDAIEDLLKETEKLKKLRAEKDSDHSDERNKHEENMAEARKERDKLKSKLNETEEELEHAQEMVKEREVAIEDLLRDIEGLKQDGSDLEKRVTTRTNKLTKEIKDKTKKLEKLQAEFEEVTNRLNEAQNDLQSKAQKLQEREEEIEELLQDVGELKRQHAEELKAKAEGERASGEDKEELAQALDVAQEVIKGNEEKIREMLDENAALKEDLKAARANKVHFEREKEDDESDSEEGDTKSYLVAQQEVLEEEIQQLNDQVGDLQEELEEVHRQNAILNEEVEDWLQRGGNFELEIQRLKNEVEGWEDRAEQFAEAHHAMGKDDGGSGGGQGDKGDQQAMLLEKAMADRQRKAGQGKGVWGLIFNQSEEEEDLTEDQKRIRELEAIKDAQAEELQKVKSDLVKLTTSSRNDSYVSKKKITDLEEENEGYKAKVELLLRRLSEVQGVPYGDDDDDEEEDEKKTDDPVASNRVAPRPSSTNFLMSRLSAAMEQY